KERDERKFRQKPFGKTMIALGVGFITYVLILTFLSEFADVSQTVADTLIYILYGMITLFLTLLYGGILFSARIVKKKKIVKIKISKLMNNTLEDLEDEHPKIFAEVQKALEVALEDGTKQTVTTLFYTMFLSELLLAKTEVLIRDTVKRLAFTIANGNFIIESLDLTSLVNNTDQLESLQTIVASFDEVYKLENAMEIPHPILVQEFVKIIENFAHIMSILESLKKIQTDKQLAAKIKIDTEKLRALTKTSPVAKTNVSFRKASRGIAKHELLSTITALDEEIVELRTRAGTYYVSLSTIQKKGSREHREIELLTDKELEVKIEVIDSALEMLEEEKQNISKKDYQEIKRENLTVLFATKKALEKRKGTFKKITCPYCQAKNSTIQEHCKKCNKELPYCIVCLNSIGQGEQVSICPHCQSFAHAGHFKEWLKKSTLCPYCKRKIKGTLPESTLGKITKS
ncbi:MAG: hypothetical protein ACTSQB_07075, partial [Candidatus Heimdallarchaeota archaeon]